MTDQLTKIKVPKNFKKMETSSAVLIPFCTVKGVPSLMYNIRSSKLKSHRGEVCFPGGRRNKGPLYRYTDCELDIPISINILRRTGREDSFA